MTELFVKNIVPIYTINNVFQESDAFVPEIPRDPLINQRIIGGTIEAAEIHIPNKDASANSFHSDNVANFHWGCTAEDFTTDNDNAAAYILNTGQAKFQNIVLSNSVTISGIQSGSEIAIQGWQEDMTFSVTDADTVAWGSGTITLLDGTTYSIDAGNTGNMAALTYVYLDIGTSLTVLQVTTTAATAVGSGKILIAVAKNSTNEALFQVFGGKGGIKITGPDLENLSLTHDQIAANTIRASEITANTITASEIAANTITASEIAANTITANEIVANTITATEMNVSQLSAISANLGTITAGTITTDTLIVGTDVITAESRFNTLFTKGCFIGSVNDGAIETANMGLTRGTLRTTFTSSDGTNPASLSTTNFGANSGEIGENIGFANDIEMVCVTEMGGTTSTRCFWGVLESTWAAGIPDDATSTNRHIGFFIHDGSLYASNADDTTQTSTEITGITLTTENKYRFVFTSGTNILFYVNDVLKATHTTNLPSGNINALMFIGFTGNHQFTCYNNYFVIVTV